MIWHGKLRLLRLGIYFVTVPAIISAQSVYSRGRHGGAPAKPNFTAYKDAAGSFRGKLKGLSDKEIMIENGDHQIVSIRRSRKTKFLNGKDAIKASDIDLETLVTVVASEDSGLKLTAVSVNTQ